MGGDAMLAHKFMPQGMTPELEAHLIGVVATVKANQTRSA
jgi:hypothetical protein